MIIDFHSHLLPGIDDGATDISMSLEIINTEINNNVDIILASPHYYCEEQSIESFINKRDEAYSSLKQHLIQGHFPKIVLGAEVYYSQFLRNCTDLSKLFIEGTNYLLLELPYRSITKDIIDNIISLADAYAFTPIIAHAERYLKYTSLKSLLPLFESDVLCQINCGSIVNRTTRKNAYKIIKNGYVFALGSDVHNTTTRPVLMNEAISILNKKYSPKLIEDIMNSSEKILKNKDIDYILGRE